MQRTATVTIVTVDGGNYLCLWCRHSNIRPGETEYLDYTCTAFPEGIPDEILDNRFDHRRPLEGDHGIQFEPTPAPKRIPEIIARIKFATPLEAQ